MNAPMPQDGPGLPTAQIMSQWWRDVVFLHWPVEPERVAPLLPPGTRPDVFDGSAWVGLIPFRMVDAGLGRLGPVPWLGSFLETNVRVYSLDEQGRHGVVFCSLDAERLAVVAGARLGFGVPYRWARMSSHESVPGEADPGADGGVGAGADDDGHLGRRLTYASRRRTPGQASGPRTRIGVEVGAWIEQPSALEVFLTARFGLHTHAFGRTLWVPNSHGAWPLRRAVLLDLDDQLVAAAGLGGIVSSAAPTSVVCSTTGVRTTFGRPQRIG